MRNLTIFREDLHGIGDLNSYLIAIVTDGVRQSDGMTQEGWAVTGTRSSSSTMPPATAGSSRNALVARDGRRFTGGSRGNTRGGADAFACLDAGG
jgi:hypothetical protein